ncbi:thrombospondin type 1 domain protein [Ancylostoma duodenale]|uniref:Thrombospondin type 1 domain protein n=1 Tax=Ancylostoma duodenale TaxID=51022 RepID=A0A0C2F6J2_9BILA|nr:thrombospondin type 1 domain protein [Ancylostoma duodenale]
MWSPWSECSATCGESIQKRFRYCENSDPKRGVDCKGELMETKPCKVPDCIGTVVLTPIQSWQIAPVAVQ